MTTTLTNMDRKISQSKVTWRRASVFVAVATGVAALVIGVILSNRDFYVVDIANITVSPVSSGQFLDFVPIRGVVTPLDTVFLDAVEGGRVEAVLAEEGSFVVIGQPILRMSNTALQLDVISREAQVAEQVNSLRNTRLSMEQNRLSLRGELVELDYQILKLSRSVSRLEGLLEGDLVSEEEYQDAIDQLEYYQFRREVTLESQAVDERMRVSQIESLEATVDRLERNLGIAQSNLENLNVLAPMAGQLTDLNAEVGQSKSRGERLGQIDSIEHYKVVAEVDEYYLTRTRVGQTAELQMLGQTYLIAVDKIYPEVSSGRFIIDLTFLDAVPNDLRRGQSLQMRLALGSATNALLLPRGGFFQDTGGNWAFVLDESGTHAMRRSLSIGRSNPDYLEILGGAVEGDRVITSSYSGLADKERIKLVR